jgi:UDP-N-acetylglucosamine diphosphorylase / glucose-1-phosphate thymidylyltransferase / UDP-N-acetylgalactosamine diphosphorylase / glucosamine-1-phosphate N-acetyltransferase / galactosamine-1-phosphate N-acetyltransferase
MFRPENFFDLSSFEYADLFADLEYTWEALARLEGYLLAHTHKEQSIHGAVHAGAFLVGEHILIEEGAIVEPGAYIEGPCIIGRDCVVRHGAYVRANMLAGAGSLIGHATETKNAILLPESKAAHFAYVGDSILGRRVNLGAGTKLANYRLGGGLIKLHVNNQSIPTGRNKLGAILGDDCQLGCNSVCNPGTLLGPRCAVRPLAVVSGYHPARSQLKPEGS